jgi:5-formyltetrahydrofolate cyclo-ligase
MTANKSSATTQLVLRREARARRDAIPDQARQSASKKIADKVIRMPHFQHARSVGCYLSIGNEVDTSAIILRGWRTEKRIFVPITRVGQNLLFREITPESEFSAGPFGIPEPVNGPTLAAISFDLVIVPVVAFDSKRHRIGMGGGHYDRTFSFLGHRRSFLKPKLVGIAFDCQKVEEIAPNPWDIRLFCVVTESS